MSIRFYLNFTFICIDFFSATTKATLILFPFVHYDLFDMTLLQISHVWTRCLESTRIIHFVRCRQFYERDGR